MTEQEKLEQAMVALEAQRIILGDVAVEAALAGLRQKLAELQSTTLPSSSDFAGERKLVTVMFADLSGFTALSEKLDPEQVRAMMNRCFNALVPIVEKYGGVVDKFIGDEIMALFGAPAAHENDAERALRAALEMMDALTVFNIRSGTNLGMHFGINTGIVVAGGLGSEGRQQYSVMGDTVNLAARLEDASETGQILVGPNTYRLTAPLFHFETLPPIRVKGKAGLIAVYQLTGLKSEPEMTRGLAGLRSPLVGRKVEFQRILATVQNLSTGTGGIMAITGEPGVGKSRLVAEVRQAITNGIFPGRTVPPDPLNILWAESRALSYSENISYSLVQSLLDDLIGVSPDTLPADVATTLYSSVEQLFPEAGHAVEIYPYLARLRNVPLDANTEEHIRQVLPEVLQQRMEQAFGELVQALCHFQPVILVWEDLHWVDPSSLRLLEMLLPLAGTAPLLLLLTFRSHEGHAGEWYQDITATHSEAQPLIELSPLSDTESQQLIAHLLKIENLPETTQQLILTKAEGNPFFLEELLRSLLDAGFLLIEADRVVAVSTIEQLEVPDTLQGVIAARTDRLPLEYKRTLQTAAVIGRVFQQPVLAYLIEREKERIPLDDSLAELQQRELIRHQMGSEYIFKHAMTQDVVYNSLLLAKRKALHRVTAEAIEVLFPAQREEFSATLAYHYQRAEMPDKAILYLVQAANRARQTYSNTEAIIFYQAALEQAQSLADSQEQLAQLYENLGDVLVVVGQGDDARNTYREALAQVSPNDWSRHSRLYRKEGDSWIAQRRPNKALQAYDQAETAIASALTALLPGSQSEWLEIQLARMWAHYWLNHLQEQIELAGKIQPVIEQYGSSAQRASFFRQLVTLAFRRNNYMVSEETLGYAHVALAASQETGDLASMAFSIFVCGLCYKLRKEWREAEVYLFNALKLAEQIGDTDRRVLSLYHIADLYQGRGEVEKTRQYASLALEAATAAKILPYIGLAQGLLAWLAWREGLWDQAGATAQAGLKIVREIPIPKELILCILIAVALHQARDGEAIEYARDLLGPGQLPLPETLNQAVQDAIKAWEEGETPKVHFLLQQTVESAQQAGWL